MKTNNLLKQAISFIFVSGIGWILDFSTFIILTNIFDFKILFANMLSAIPALSYVFIRSNKSIFKNQNSKLDLKYKYIIYFIYQIILVTSISFLGESLFKYFVNKIDIAFILNNLKIIIKIFITPITMFLNFVIMKNLIEKL
ncbi:MAG: hypothetical protein E7172_02890 [Firmicutes bacterium]|nr:hypothetical protein [Bacillota bacterium]